MISPTRKGLIVLVIQAGIGIAAGAIYVEHRDNKEAELIYMLEQQDKERLELEEHSRKIVDEIIIEMKAS